MYVEGSVNRGDVIQIRRIIALVPLYSSYRERTLYRDTVMAVTPP